MKQSHLILFLMLSYSCVADAHVLPYFSIRSQSENAARELVLRQTEINLPCQEDNYGAFSITPEYTRSYKAELLARSLFCDAIDTSTCCDNKCSVFRVQGSHVVSRNPRALLADYFGLPTDYDSTITLEPRIQNFLIDFNVYVGLDRWSPGLYFRIHAPFVHTKWDLGFCEEITTTGAAAHPLGYFNGQVNGSSPNFYGVARENLVSTFEGFITRRETPNIDGIIFQPLEYARIAKCGRSIVKLSDIQFALGWNMLACDDYHVGINIRAAAPTGSRPEGCWLFEPIVGNGKHWEAGAGFSAHWTLWHKDETDNFSFYIDANITHLFKARQCRTFDLYCKPLSRYMLAAKMTAEVNNLANGNGEPPAYQFANEFSPIANLSTMQVDVSAAVQGDLVFKFAYTNNNFQFDLGYEFWGRSCEKIHPSKCITNADTWALKGDAFVYGFTAASSDSSIPLSASEQDATVFCGTNNAQRIVQHDLYWTRNPGIDNPELAYDDTGIPILNNQDVGSANFYQIYSSFDPIIFSTENNSLWNFDAQSRGISHKIFADFGYIWKNHCPWQPFIGIGLEVEIGRNDKCCSVEVPHCITTSPTSTELPINRCNQSWCDTNNKSCCPVQRDKICIDAAVSQWGLWIKGGASYN